MYRSDGYRVKGNDPMYEIVPHIMPQRYDASNSIKVNIDLEPMQDYIRQCRRRGVSILSHEHHHCRISAAGFAESLFEPFRYEQENLCAQSFLCFVRNAYSGGRVGHGEQVIFQLG